MCYNTFSQELILVSITQNHECIIAYLNPPMFLNVRRLIIEKLLCWCPGPLRRHWRWQIVMFSFTLRAIPPIVDISMPRVMKMLIHLYNNIHITDFVTILLSRAEAGLESLLWNTADRILTKVGDMNHIVIILIVILSYLIHMMMNIIYWFCTYQQWPFVIWKGSYVEVRYDYHHTSNISRTLVGNYIHDYSDVVRASPVGAAPITSSLST